MDFRSVIHVIGLLLFLLGAAFCFPLIISLWLSDGTAFPMMIGMFSAFGVGGVCFFSTRGNNDIGRREGFLVVTFTWLAYSAIGALPFWFGADIFTFTDAFFESMSGFSTTGATILTDIESLPRGLLFWRSYTHWLGGMGIIVLSLAILPIFGIGGMQLFKAEVPGPTKDRLKPRIAETAKTLWIVYVLLSVIEAILLLAGGMDLIDSLCHTFGSMATGGFSTRNASIGAFDSAYIDYVIIVFMFLAGVNFVLHYAALKGSAKVYWQSEEFLFYFSSVAIGTIIATFFLCVQASYPFFEGLRKAMFQVVSIITTTGYGTDDFEVWPAFNQVLLLIFMLFGGCAGSTAGSVKIIRLQLMMKHAIVELYKIVHPKAVKKVKSGKAIIQDSVIHSVLAFFMLYLFVMGFCSLIMAAMGLDLVSAVSSVAATLGNIGPGFGSVGPLDNYAHIPLAGKWLLAFCMLIGRLEIYTVIILFFPEFWRK